MSLALTTKTKNEWDLFPVWMSRLVKAGFTRKKLHWKHERQLDTDNRKCIVGEAHGYDNSYTERCGDCTMYSSQLPMYFDNQNMQAFKHTLQEFVQHYNNEHQYGGN